MRALQSVAKARTMNWARRKLPYSQPALTSVIEMVIYKVFLPDYQIFLRANFAQHY